jgi:hypothetical protein
MNGLFQACSLNEEGFTSTKRKGGGGLFCYERSEKSIQLTFFK